MDWIVAGTLLKDLLVILKDILAYIKAIVNEIIKGKNHVEEAGRNLAWVVGGVLCTAIAITATLAFVYYNHEDLQLRMKQWFSPTPAPTPLPAAGTAQDDSVELHASLDRVTTAKLTGIMHSGPGQAARQIQGTYRKCTDDIYGLPYLVVNGKPVWDRESGGLFIFWQGEKWAITDERHRGNFLRESWSSEFHRALNSGFFTSSTGAEHWWKADWNNNAGRATASAVA